MATVMSKPVVFNKLIAVEIPKIIFNRSDWVKYLVVFEWQKRVIDEKTFAAITSEKFNKLVGEHIKAYVFDKKMPPAEIAGPIMNITDDLLSGRDPILRTGDYIQLQNFMRQA